MSGHHHRTRLGFMPRVPLEQLRFHPRNIRTNLGDLTELTASVRREGVLVPLMAERTGTGGLRILHGHRRWAAADAAGRRTVPVIVVAEHTEDEALLLMLAEDLKQHVASDDRAHAFQTLRREFGYSDRNLAERFGVGEDTIRAWSAGKGPAQARPTTVRSNPAPARTARPVARPAPPSPRRPAPPRIRPAQLHAVLADWDGRAPAELLDRLRGLLGGWTPATQPGTAKEPVR